MSQVKKSKLTEMQSALGETKHILCKNITCRVNFEGHSLHHSGKNKTTKVRVNFNSNA